MTIDKAIEILEDILAYVRPGDPPDEHDALKLGIAALKRVTQISPYPHEYTGGPMPGETPEEETKEVTHEHL